MRVAIIGAGAMGSAIGRLLSDHGAQVVTPLAGRSEASRCRAAAANMTDAPLRDCTGCDFILSIVATSQAPVVAQRLAELAPGGAARPVFIECNAIHPDVARKIASQLGDTGYCCVDAGIVGGSPQPGGPSPQFLVAGEAAAQSLELARYGLSITDLCAPIGAASALKMAFAGVSKGQTALLAMMLGLAQREGVRGPFLDQLRRTQPGIVAWGARQLPQVAGKAGRWVEEMETLSALLGQVPGGEAVFAGLGAFYAGVDADPASVPELKA